MTGAPVVAAWIAQIVFWAVMVLGYATGALQLRLTVSFLILWLIGYFGLPQLTSVGALLDTPYVAVLDIALILVVFRGDLRLS